MKSMDWKMEISAQASVQDPIGFLARHSRSFRFAARFLPEIEARRVAEVYAFCRPAPPG